MNDSVTRTRPAPLGVALSNAGRLASYLHQREIAEGWTHGLVASGAIVSTRSRGRCSDCRAADRGLARHCGSCECCS